jgi:hypothetical protein
MSIATAGKELIIKLHNDVGALHKVSVVLAESGIDLLALSCWIEGTDGYIRFVVEDHRRSLDLLRERGYSVEERDVIWVTVPHKVGKLEVLSEKLAREGIGIRHMYATTLEGNESCRLVMSTTRNDHAIVTLNKPVGGPG